MFINIFSLYMSRHLPEALISHKQTDTQVHKDTKMTGLIAKHKKSSIAFFLLLIIAVTAIYHKKMIVYGIKQGTGQMNILLNRIPVNEYIKRSGLSKEELDKIRLIDEIIRFAVDDIGLDDHGAYRTIYDQKNRPLLYLVTAAPEFSLSPYRWNFPVAGSFSYLGFFDLEDARKEAKILKDKGYDVRIREVSAWSTLGYFKDPVFTGMLKRSEGSLANLIIHEMTHGTVFIKNNMRFNENIATFIGDTGAILFLKKRYGENSDYLKKYIESQQDSDLFYSHIINETRKLKDLYDSFDDSMTCEYKKDQKNKMISSIMESIADIPFNDPDKYKHLADYRPTNAWFTGYRTYRVDIGKISDIYRDKYHSDLKLFVKAIKDKKERILD